MDTIYFGELKLISTTAIIKKTNENCWVRK